MKLRFILLGLILFTGVFTAMVFQADPYIAMKNVADFKSGMNKKNQSITSMKCDFVQEKNLSFMAQKVISKGNMKYKKPDMMKLEYNTPFSYVMSLYKGKVYIKDNGKVNKFDTQSNKLFKYINDLMINAVQGNVLDNKDFKIVYKENNKLYLMEMEPLQEAMKDYVNKVKIYVNKTDFEVSKIEMSEKSGDYTLITFLNRIYNSSLKDEEFMVH
jgi:outer membrane lipoprotein-sorting protein